MVPYIRIVDLAVCGITVHARQALCLPVDCAQRLRLVLSMQRMYAMYADAMRALNFSAQTPAYVSSGLFSYNGTGELLWCMYQLTADMSALFIRTVCCLTLGRQQPCGTDCGAGADNLTEKFGSAGVLSTMTHKEQLLSREELAGWYTD